MDDRKEEFRHDLPLCRRSRGVPAVASVSNIDFTPGTHPCGGVLGGGVLELDAALSRRVKHSTLFHIDATVGIEGHGRSVHEHRVHPSRDRGRS
jgi:hypothetical protein